MQRKIPKGMLDYKGEPERSFPLYPGLRIYIQQHDGRWEPAIPEPFYWGFFPWIRRRLSGYRDEYGRKAVFIGWREGIIAALFESW